MSAESLQSESIAPELGAARTLTNQVAFVLDRSPSYRALDTTAQAALRRDVTTIQRALALPAAAEAVEQGDLPPPPSPQRRVATDRRAYAEPLALRGPAPAWRNGLDTDSNSTPNTPSVPQAQPSPAAEHSPTQAATQTLAGRVGALSDEVDFPTFVASLVHGTFDAMVNATIRQMEAFASLVGAIAKDVDEFTRDNVTSDQVRDFLVQQHPHDLTLDLSGKTAQLRRRPSAASPAADDTDTSSESPTWLADYGLDGAVLDDQTIEDQLIPAARRHVGEDRMRTLATMVLLGMSRINVKDGTISARVRFRAAARDNAQVAYNQSDDPAGQTSWGARGSAAYDMHQTRISTISANVQSDSQLNVELFGEVRINFASETLPLDRFMDPARLALIQRHARGPSAATAGAPESASTETSGAAPSLNPTPGPTPAPVLNPGPQAPTPAAP